MTEVAPRAARLTQWPPTLDLDPSWTPAVKAFMDSSAGRELTTWLSNRIQSQAVVYPPDPFRFLRLNAMGNVRVVILGQDPYHGPGQAEGLAFSVAPGVKPPPSLRNIFKELQRDLGLPPPPNGSLVRWAEQGVMLLNTCLTVEEGAPGSHAGKGWEALTDSILKSCNEDLSPKVFMFWGAHAQKRRPLIDTRRHLVLCANHPSPLSALRGPEPFLGCGHFGEAARWLTSQGLLAPRW